MRASPLIQALTAPARLFRYFNEPGVAAEARFDALSEEEKAERRYQGMKRAAFRVFPSPFSNQRKRPKRRGTP